MWQTHDAHWHHTTWPTDDLCICASWLLIVCCAENSFDAKFLFIYSVCMVDGIFGRMSRFLMSIHRIAKCSSIIYRKIATNGYKVKQQRCLPFTNNRMYRWKERKKLYTYWNRTPLLVSVDCAVYTPLVNQKSTFFFVLSHIILIVHDSQTESRKKNRLTKYEFRWRSSRYICDAWIFFDFEIFKWNTRKQLQYWNS